MNIENHPCFSESAKMTYGRIHLPVAPKCNVKCVFCNRKYDCINESRPGVTSTILKPKEAAFYFEEMKALNPWLAVVGIAGPGDAFATPEETLETLSLIRKKDPDILFCVATNGLNLKPYIDDLAALGLSHLTITLNSIDPLIGEKIYSWINNKSGIVNGPEAAEELIVSQTSLVTKLYMDYLKCNSKK